MDFKLIKIPKKYVILFTSYLTAILVALGGLTFLNYTKRANYEMQLRHNYERSLEDIAAGMNNITVALEKSIYVSTATQLSKISSELSREASIVKSSISQLPNYNNEYDSFNKFLSQVGDYTSHLSKKVISGGNINDQERTNLVTLTNTAKNICGAVDSIKNHYEQYGFISEDLSSEVEGAASDTLLSDGIDMLKDTFTDYPTLIYDGPFSDHMLISTPKMLGRTEEVTKEYALEVAANALGVEMSALSNDSDELGNMPSYCFTGENINVAVSKIGGYVIYFRKYREVGEQKLSLEDAVKKANDYISANNNYSFKDTYYFTDEGICVINFAGVTDTTLCYPDLIKVGVALDTGEIMMYEGRGFLMNYHDRTISVPKHSEKEAEQVLSDALTPVQCKRVIIPSSSNEEKHCYEFLCNGINNDEILVYINVDTLMEEDILLLLKTDGGILTK